jgi:hypothetical protein
VKRAEPPHRDPVHQITSAPRSHTEDQDARIQRYLISMGIRTVCVILVFVVSGPLRWVFIVGAVVLPYVAVVMANAADHRHRTDRVTPEFTWSAPDPPDGPGNGSDGGPASSERMSPQTTEPVKTDPSG